MEYKISSDDLGEFSKAFNKMQASLHKAKKDSENPFYKSKYADLASVWEACKDPLHSNGFSVQQIMIKDDNGSDLLITNLLHESTQWMRSYTAIKCVNSDPQAYGSAITYARRYGLTSLIGIIQDDDDGNLSSGKSGNESVKMYKPETKSLEKKCIECGKPSNGMPKCNSCYFKDKK